MPCYSTGWTAVPVWVLYRVTPHGTHARICMSSAALLGGKAALPAESSMSTLACVVRITSASMTSELAAQLGGGSIWRGHEAFDIGRAACCEL